MSLEYKNNRNVYIVGAGFSKARGLPLVAEFLNAARDSREWLEVNRRDTEAAAIAKVLEFRLKASSAAERMHVNLENIEELFSLASATPNADITSHIKLTIASTLEFAEQRTADCTAKLSMISDNRIEPRAHWVHGEEFTVTEGAKAIHGRDYRVPAYDGIIGIMTGALSAVAPSESTIISFNYDLLAERAMVNLGTPFTYCLPRAQFSTKCDWKMAETGVKLLKLHGSVNWAYPGARGKRLTVYDSYSSVRAAGLVPVLVPPTWRKDFAGPLVGVWKSAVDSLKQATRVIIVGYSLPLGDPHFRYLLAAGLSGNANLRSIEIMDPQVGQLEDRLFGVIRKELQERGQVKVLNTTAFGGFSSPDTCARLGRALAPTYRYFTCD